MAAYIQDKFTINELIFRLGVRFDRYDVNTKVLKNVHGDSSGVRGAADLGRSGDLIKNKL